MVIIDNYDSFTYNLVHYIEEITGRRPIVMRNDAIDFSIIEKSSHLILSPGPGLPKDAGKMLECIHLFHAKKKILGVCLGHQALCQYFGAQLENPEKVHHGVDCEITVSNQDVLYRDMPSDITVGRYHSWIVGNNNFPSRLEVTARDSQNTIMSFKHPELPLFGVQYHPESLLTPLGKHILRNFFLYS